MNTKDLKLCLSLMDLTSLNTTDTYSKIASLTAKVNDFKKHFPNYPTPASICVYPNFAKTIKENLTAQGVNITVVAGVFPNSQSFIEVKLAECAMTVAAGADEVDIVLNHSYFGDGLFEKAALEISEIKKKIGDKIILKVILETGILSPENIEKASWLAMEAGADFIKTSTGKLEPAATIEAAKIMCRAIKEFHAKTGKKIGFKPAGGMVVPSDAAEYLAVVRKILGEDWVNPSFLRLGASRLANNILSELEDKTISYY